MKRGGLEEPSQGYLHADFQAERSEKRIFPATSPKKTNFKTSLSPASLYFPLSLTYTFRWQPDGSLQRGPEDTRVIEVGSTENRLLARGVCYTLTRDTVAAWLDADQFFATETTCSSAQR